jgi:hypothetical protein
MKRRAIKRVNNLNINIIYIIRQAVKCETLLSIDNMKCEDSVDRTDHPSQHAISVNKLNTQEEWMEKELQYRHHRRHTPHMSRAKEKL